ncbi:ribosome recycling factor [Candidatus Parcubacteria bacterium]|nr:ribosome recycling factor [Candidatus Parcubacteria bacterium]
MAQNFSGFKQAAEATVHWLQGEFAGLRTGRATPNILDAVSVEAYGSKMAVNQLASVTIEDPRTLRVTPWDKAVVKSIDSAIRESNLGLSVSVDDQGLRISFPELTSDRRQSLVKVAKQKLEEARVRIRSERQKVLNEIEKSEAGDDDKARSKTELQKQVDDINKKLEEMSEKKEKEISE